MSRGADNTRINICIYRYKKRNRINLCQMHIGKNVLSFFLNASMLEQDCKSLGRLFQAAGPAKLNPRSPNLVQVQRLT